MAYSTAVNNYGTVATASEESRVERERSSTLGTDAFLQLLVTQIRYQDPLSGQQDTGEMLVQLSLFTILEQVINLQAEAEKQYAALQSNQALSMLNKEVLVETEYGLFSGTVTGVSLIGDSPKVILDDLAEFPLSAVKLVENEGHDQDEDE